MLANNDSLLLSPKMGHLSQPKQGSRKTDEEIMERHGKGRGEKVALAGNTVFWSLHGDCTLKLTEVVSTCKSPTLVLCHC